MDRKTFLQRFSMSAAGIMLAPKIIAASMVKESDNIIYNHDFTWNSNQIFIRIVNNNPVPTEVMLFGVNKQITGNIIPDGVKIFVAGSTNQQLQQAIRANPIRILGLIMKSKQQMQFSNPIVIYKEGSNGRLSSEYFQPLNYRSAYSMDLTRIDVPGFELLLTPSVYLMNTINANEQVDYIFNIEQWKIILDNTSSVPNFQIL